MQAIVDPEVRSKPFWLEVERIVWLRSLFLPWEIRVAASAVAELVFARGPEPRTTLALMPQDAFDTPEAAAHCLMWTGRAHAIIAHQQAVGDEDLIVAFLRYPEQAFAEELICLTRIENLQHRTGSSLLVGEAFCRDIERIDNGFGVSMERLTIYLEPEANAAQWPAALGMLAAHQRTGYFVIEPPKKEERRPARDMTRP